MSTDNKDVKRLAMSIREAEHASGLSRATLLIQAKGCLDPSRQFRARATQTVTVLETGEKRLAAPPMGGGVSASRHHHTGRGRAGLG